MSGGEEDWKVQRRKLFDMQIQQSWNDQQNDSRDFDKSILAYSSAGLGVSLLIFKDVALSSVIKLGLLSIGSWVLFTVAIIATIISFRCGIKAHEAHQVKLRKYCLELDDSALGNENMHERHVKYAKNLSEVCFAIAVGLTVLFTIINVWEIAMSNDNNRNKMVSDGSGVEKGSVPIKIVEVPAPPPPPPPPPPTPKN